MNPNYTDFRFPQIKAHPWHKVCSFQKKISFQIFCFLSASQIGLSFEIEVEIEHDKVLCFRFSKNGCLLRQLTLLRGSFNTHQVFVAQRCVKFFPSKSLVNFHFVNQRLFLLQLEACAHPFFDELREPNARLPNGRPLHNLLNFKQEV